MTIKPHLSQHLKPLALVAAMALTANAQAAENPSSNTAPQSPWSFNLSTYLWLPSVYGDFTAGPFNKSNDFGFLDIAGKMRNFPMAFNGHFEANYERVAFYLEGNYMGMDFRPIVNSIYSSGLSSRMGIMEYGARYRLFGPSAAERVAHWDEKSNSNIFEVYVGGRTLWIGNEATFVGIGKVSNDKSVSMPLIGSKVIVEFSPHWYASLDGSIGGFGVDNVDFSGSALGTIGYRTTLFDIPTSMEVGYKALSIKVDKPILTTDVLMHGAYIGLAGYW
ncbi:MAG: hypothetical protein NTV43_12145 [Methylococcales bacterium]|nr:hypothetical protein [Methylococcales bacterium]